MKQLLTAWVYTLFVIAYATPVMAQGEYFVSLYAGEMSDSNLLEEIGQLRADYQSGTIYVLSVGKEFYRKKDSYSFEFEYQLAAHEGVQNHVETSAMVAARLLDLPWDHIIDTSFALAEGLSYAFEEPEVEIDRHDDTAKLLNYLYVEAEVTVPKYENFSLFFRIHHRSGIYGVFDGIEGGSNAVGGGIRYRFF